jgi:hypothetical protein
MNAMSVIGRGVGYGVIGEHDDVGPALLTVVERTTPCAKPLPSGI